MKALWRQWPLVFSLKITSFILALIVLLPFLAFGGVHSSAEETIKDIFPAYQEYKTEIRVLDNQEFKVFTVLSQDKIIGWVVVLDEMGKIKPITFLIAIDTASKVLAVRILEYRDMFGSEIKRRSFLRQFQGKSLKDPIKIGQDIDAVTQATISSQAAASVVRMSLKVIEGLQRND